MKVLQEILFSLLDANGTEKIETEFVRFSLVKIRLESCDLDTNRNATKNTHAKVTNVKQIY
jgi:hypothetical protein